MLITKLKKLLPRRVASAALALVMITAVSVTTFAADAKMLVPVGRAVGIRLESDGVMIVGIPDKCSDDQTPSPSRKVGFRTGDVIVRVGKTEITTGEALKSAVTESRGAPLTLHVRREGETLQFEVTPHKLATGEYSLGLYVRDGVSGIGTVTYFDPETGAYGALGHAVSDSETGTVFPLREGSVSHVNVTDVQVGKPGSPGQLRGEFDFDSKLGSICLNTENGIFGVAELEQVANEVALEVADESELHTGGAYILSNVEGDEVRRYDVEISRVFRGDEAEGRSMLVTIKDDELIARTGGIVQGMSGSPIIQDGKLVGAVTHVLINDPQKGYGISIERMLEQSAVAVPEMAA